MATATVRKKDIRAAFGKVGCTKLDDDLISKCMAVSSSLRVSPSQMALCWEAFSLNRNLTTLDSHCWEAFRSALIKFSDEHSMNTGASPYATISSSSILKRPSPPPSVTPPAKKHQQQQQNSNDGKTEPNTDRRATLSPAPPMTLSGSRSDKTAAAVLYDQRKGAGQVVHTWNPHDLDENVRPNEASPSSIRPRCVISKLAGCSETNVTQRYRHMNTNVEEKARVLDQHLVDLGNVMKERYGIGSIDNTHDENDENNSENSAESAIAGLEAVGVPRQESICCIGRICNEAQEGRMNATSILLEGSSDESGGARIKLDVSHLKTNNTPFSLFPGQIVAVEGLNPSGRTLMAHRICEGAAPLAKQTAVYELLKYHHQDEYQGGSPLKIMSVAGPYATADGLNYQPLWDFMHRVQAESPDVVIMAGPFVDMRQEAQQSGQTVVQNEDGTETLLSFEAFFAEQISAVLQEYFSDSDVGTQFILVPSLDDATAEWVFPQPPFADKARSAADLKLLSRIPGAENFVVGSSLDLQAVETVGRSEQSFRRVHCVSNPCTLCINELVLSVTSADVLFHLGLAETNANLPPGSRMERLAQHLIQQQSFCPLFPAPKEMNVDLKQMDKIGLPCQPDILICPSKLNAFARPVMEHTLVVNPGFLTKGTVGGSYATIQVHPMKREMLEKVSDGGVEMAHAIASRSRVEIKRI